MKTLIALGLFLLDFGACSKILAIFPAPPPSHYILGSSLTKALAEKGHDVTMISAFGEKHPPKVGKNGRYRDIVIKEIVGDTETHSQLYFDQEGANPFLVFTFFSLTMPQVFEYVFINKEVQELIHSDEKFDVVIVEQFMNDAQKALATHFGAPLILVSTMGPNFMLNPVVGYPAPPSYIPNTLSNYSVPMSFSERMLNGLLSVYMQLVHHYYLFPYQNSMIKKYIPNGPDIYDVLYNASIVLLNSHNSINRPVPHFPNMIDVGGFHIKPPKKLPKDLQDYLNGAKNGVIYFSMGSTLKSSELPTATRDAIIKSFSKLKQNVLWKWEDVTIPGQPPNVKLGKWLPQQDILAHPNVKLFITHGGFLSITESIYHGVPILTIPVFADQKFNSKFVIDGGFGSMLPYRDISEETFTCNIEEVLNNPKYRNNAKQKSDLFHDRPQHPLDTAIYWIEYVIRHQGAPHLQVAGVYLPWYQYHLLDVFGFLFVVSVISVFIVCYFVKFVCRKCSNMKVKKD